MIGTPYEIRTRVPTVKGSCPSPLDERSIEFGTAAQARTEFSLLKRQDFTIKVYTVLNLVGAVGFEPTTLGLKVRCCFRLSYTPIEFWQGRWESNPHLTASKTVALPVKLHPNRILRGDRRDSNPQLTHSQCASFPIKIRPLLSTHFLPREYPFARYSSSCSFFILIGLESLETQHVPN